MTIISRAHKFIYLKSYKTASTSAEVFLINSTPLGRDIYKTSQDILKYGHPVRQRSMVRRGIWGPLAVDETRSGLQSKLAYRLLAKSGFRSLKQHCPAAVIANVVGSEFFGSAYKFTSIRNPWDCLVSHYCWQRDGRQGRSAPKPDLQFDAHLEDLLTRLGAAPLMWSFLQIDEQWIVDDVVVFEALADSLDELCKRVGVAAAADVPPSEKRNRQGEDYRRYYRSDAQIEAVAHAYRGLLARYRYDFDRPGQPPDVMS